MTPQAALLMSLCIPLTVAIGAALWVCYYLGRDLFTGLWLVLKFLFHFLRETAKNGKLKSKKIPDEIGENGLVRILDGERYYAEILDPSVQPNCNGCAFYVKYSCILSDSVKISRSALCLPTKKNGYSHIIWKKA